jgi:hypothetical protein
MNTSAAKRRAQSDAAALPEALAAGGAFKSSVPGSYAGEKVIVASKLPMALELKILEKRTERRRYQSMQWEEDVWVQKPDSPTVTIAGTAFPNGDVPDWMERPRMIGGCALTFGVDREFWETWREQNKDTPMVKNKIVFAHGEEADVRAETRDLKEIDSGLGPIAHKKDADGNDMITDRRAPRKLGRREAVLASAE